METSEDEQEKSEYETEESDMETSEDEQEPIDIEDAEDDSCNKLAKGEPQVKWMPGTTMAPDTSKDKIQDKDKTGKEIAEPVPPTQQRTQKPMVQESPKDVLGETDIESMEGWKNDIESEKEPDKHNLPVDRRPILLKAAESIEDKQPEDDSKDGIAKGEPPVKEKSENKAPDFSDLIVASTSETNVLNHNGGVINIGGCKITFPEGSFTEDTTIETKAEINSARWPEGYFCITAMLYCKASNEMQKTASVELTSWCMHSGTDESKKIEAHVLHQSKDSKKWDTVAILPLTDQKKFQFECMDFSPYVIGIRTNEIGNTIFLLDGNIHTSKTDEFILSLFLQHELIENAIVRNMEKRGCIEKVTFNTIPVQKGNMVSGYIESIEEGFRFPEKFPKPLEIDKDFIELKKKAVFTSCLLGSCSQSRLIPFKCGIYQENESVDGPHYFKHEWHSISEPARDGRLNIQLAGLPAVRDLYVAPVSSVFDNRQTTLPTTQQLVNVRNEAAETPETPKKETVPKRHVDRSGGSSKSLRGRTYVMDEDSLPSTSHGKSRRRKDEAGTSAQPPVSIVMHKPNIVIARTYATRSATIKNKETGTSSEISCSNLKAQMKDQGQGQDSSRRTREKRLRDKVLKKEHPKKRRRR